MVWRLEKDQQRAVFQPTAVVIFVMTAAWLGGKAWSRQTPFAFFLLGLPAVLLGTWVGMKLYGRVHEGAFRKRVKAGRFGS
jgi:uncharacterized membrane protein YfcA